MQEEVRGHGFEEWEEEEQREIGERRENESTGL